MLTNKDIYDEKESLIDNPKKQIQNCPQCNYLIGIMPGSRDAICTNCGYKDPCCD